MSEQEGQRIARQWKREVDEEIRIDDARQKASQPWQWVVWGVLWLLWLLLLLMLIVSVRTLAW